MPTPIGVVDWRHAGCARPYGNHSTSLSGARAVNGPDLSRLPHIRTRYGFTLVYTLLDILQRDAPLHFYCSIIVVLAILYVYYTYFSHDIIYYVYLVFFKSLKCGWNEQIEKYGSFFRFPNKDAYIVVVVVVEAGIRYLYGIWQVFVACL